jgi:hypothetical protein
LKLAEHGFEPLGGQGWQGLFVAAPDAAGHQHLFTPFQGTAPSKPTLAGCITHIAAEPDVSTAAKGLLGLGQQQLRGPTNQVLPARMNGEFHVMAPTGVLPNPAHSGDRLIPGPIDQNPALAMALIEQVFDPPVQQLAELGRASGLLEVPEQGPGAAVERPQL